MMAVFAAGGMRAASEVESFLKAENVGLRDSGFCNRVLWWFRH